MKTTVQRALWAFKLKVTVLRHPLPPAPALAPESQHEPKPATRADFKVLVNGRPVDVVTRWEPVPGGPEHHKRLKVTIPEGTLKVGGPLRVQELVDAYIKATADEPGELDHLAAFQRFHLGEPYPYKVGVDLGSGDDFTYMWTEPRHGGYVKPEWFKNGGEHGGGVRLVGESAPKLERQVGRTSRQMLDAPIGAAFLWLRDELSYPRNLARHLGRTDLKIVGPSWLQHGWRGLRLPALVLDHAAWGRLTRIQHDMLDNAMDYIGSRPHPVVSWPRRAGKATALQALEAAQRERWCRDLDREIRLPASWNLDDLEGSSCD
jgi:hypothetical protein